MKIWQVINLALWAFTGMGSAQIQWANPVEDKGWQVEGRIWHEEGYGRLPAKAKNTLRAAVWNLGAQSAGLKIRFWTNSPEIHLQYELTGSLAMPHMPATGVSGFDLYRRTSEGKQYWVATTKPGAKNATVKLAAGLDHHPKVPGCYTLYLPLYNSVRVLKIGVPKGKTLTPAIPNGLKPIVVYGTSIAQGACASRPGLAWTAVLERNLDRPLINLGFSGNGRMELEVADLFLEQDAAVYVIDCLPNLNEKLVREKIGPLLTRIRKIRPNTPVLLVEEPLRDNAIWSKSGAKVVEREWAALRAEYDRRKATDKNLYYLKGKDLLGRDGEATVDAVHPNDIGMRRYALAYEKALRPILGMERSEVTAGVPATPQLREVPGYNFLKRHQAILARNQQLKPDLVWLGDSIVHFFAGEPKAPYVRGADAWAKLFAGRKVTNLAYGWDRTENVLWRIQRGELDDISPKVVMLSIGTNDLSVGRTPAQVCDSIFNLVKEIKKRQPEARVVVTGILPRGNHRQELQKVNGTLKSDAQRRGYEYLDLSGAFPTVEKNGKTVISGMYGDQVHPNTEGYTRLADLVAKFFEAK